jgi:hypothetical protein
LPGARLAFRTHFVLRGLLGVSRRDSGPFEAEGRMEVQMGDNRNAVVVAQTLLPPLVLPPLVMPPLVMPRCHTVILLRSLTSVRAESSLLTLALVSGRRNWSQSHLPGRF